MTPLAPELLALCAPCTGCTADPKQHLDGPFVDACLAFEREQSQRFERVYRAIEQLEQDNAALKLIIYRLKASAVSMTKPRFSEEYRRHLASPEWKAFRRRAIEASCRRCQRCGASRPFAIRPRDANDSLHVHHLHYETLGHEAPDDVLVLCEECHALADGERRAANATEAHLRRGLAALGKE